MKYTIIQNKTINAITSLFLGSILSVMAETSNWQDAWNDSSINEYTMLADWNSSTSLTLNPLSRKFLLDMDSHSIIGTDLSLSSYFMSLSGNADLSITNGSISYIENVVIYNTAKISLIECVDFNSNGNSTALGGVIANNGGTIVSIYDSNFTYNTALLGGALYNSQTGIISAISASDFSNNSANYGGAIYNIGTIYIVEDQNGEKTYFTNNSANYGGAIYNKGTLSISNAIFDKNTIEEGFGGAIFNLVGYQISSISDSTFTNNQASYGGAIYNEGLIEAISNTTFSNNVADRVEDGIYRGSGGAIHNEINGVINLITGSYSDEVSFTDETVSNADFYNNSAYHGGAIYNEGSIIKLDSLSFINNQASDATGGSYGGAILNYSDIGTLSNSYFYGNTSDRGGAINNLSYIETISNVVFTYNQATGDGGGAIANDTASGFTTEINLIENSIFSYNESLVVGGAIYNTSLITKIDNTDFYKNESSYGGAIANYNTITTMIDLDFTENIASYGGAIYNLSGALISTIESSIFNSNESSFGGAIYNEGTITDIIDSTFTLNQASSSDNGGAIYNEGTIVSITSSTFSENSAYRGGAIFNETGATIGSIIGSYSSDDDPTDADYDFDFYKNEGTWGGAIRNNGSITISLSNLSFSLNSATTSGGVIYNIGNINLIENSYFYKNSAKYGGGIYNDGDITSILNTIFSNNSATYWGGGVYNSSDIDTITSSFLSNTAGYGGSGIYNIGNIDTISSTFTSNTATTTSNYSDAGGGAIFNKGTIENIVDSEFSDNSAVYRGGAIMNYGGTIETISSTFTSNTVTSTTNSSSAGGGAIYNTGTIENIVDSEFSENSAAYRGGAIMNYGGTIETISSSEFSDNSALYFGAAIYNTGTIETVSDATFTLNTVTTTTNYSDVGGAAIYNTASIDIIEDSEFTSNNAGRGGAIMNYGGTIETITGSDFSNNIATYRGGAIYNTGTIETISDATFTLNTVTTTANYSDYGGAAIYNTGTIDIIEDSEFTSNNAGRGAAIMNYDGTIETITGSEFSNNTVTYRGGAICYTSAIDTISDSTFTNNKVSSSTLTVKGGAIYASIQGLETSLDELTFTNNSATIDSTSTVEDIYGYGGAIHLELGLMEISNSTFESNSATIGGAISTATSYDSRDYWETVENFDAANKLIVNSSTFSNNIGGIAGGAMAIYSDAVITNTTFDGNISNDQAGEGGGGAIYVGGWARIDIYSSTFSNNSGGEGGAIATTPNGQTSDVYLYISDTTFDSNSASFRGGAISNTFSDTVLTDVTFIDNSSKGTGGAIYTNTSINFASTSESHIKNIGNYASDDASGGFLYLDGSSASATFNTADSSSITIGNGSAGYDSIAGTGEITKTGEGTLTVNSSMQYFTGALNVEDGLMEVNNVLGASEITIGTTSTDGSLALLINSNNVLSNSSLSTISFENANSTLVLLSTSVSTTQDLTYTLSANTTSFEIAEDDLTKVLTYGGSYSDNVFTVTQAATANSSDISVDDSVVLNGSSNLVITSDTSSSDVIISTSSAYSSETTAITISTATEITNAVTADGDSSLVYDAISKEVSSEFTVVSSWDFDIIFEDSEDSVVVSFLIGEGLDLSTISLYHTDDDNVATDVTSSIISYDENGYLSFDASSFSSYTVISVPEPSTYAMIFAALALGLAMYRRRK